MKKYYLPEKVLASGDERMNNESIKKLFGGFCFGRSEIIFQKGDNCCLVIGSTSLPQIPDGAEYALRIDENGAAVSAKDYACLIRGYTSMLMQIDFDADGKLYLTEANINGIFKIARRMVHYCVFPETTFHQFRKLIRYAALMQFTHVVIEFWGMIKLDCFKELAWDNAYDKDEVRAIIKEIKELGLEPIPMFNHLGHATASRLVSGKHVVLDRYPHRYSWFTLDGWAWNIDNEEVWDLLKAVRLELYDLFGEGEYFHAGLDEAYIYANDPERYAKLPEFMEKLTKEIEKEGRRPMLWADMFLPPEAYGDFAKKELCAKNSVEACSAVVDRLSRKTILIDWQYHHKEAPISTTVHFKNSGLDVMGAPWLDVDNARAHADTIVENKLFGIMQTTWHTLPSDLQRMIIFARYCGLPEAPWSKHSAYREETATLMRKISYEIGKYEDFGWMEYQVIVSPQK